MAISWTEILSLISFELTLAIKICVESFAMAVIASAASWLKAKLLFAGNEPNVYFQ